MLLRKWLARIVMTGLIISTALVSVGLTAPADGPFSIVVHPVFLGVDIDIKFGAMHTHWAWSALPLLIG